MDNLLNYEIRPWGKFEILDDHNTHKVKRITVTPGKRLSLQRHKRRSEHWFFVEGSGLVTLNDLDIKAEKGFAVDIGMNDLHRVENSGDCNLVFIEIQTGEYFGEDDIERIEDDYGR